MRNSVLLVTAMAVTRAFSVVIDEMGITNKEEKEKWYRLFSKTFREELERIGKEE